MNDKQGTIGASTEGDSIRAALVTGLGAFAMVRGLSREEILDVTGLSLSDLLDPDGRLPARAFHLLWKRLAAHCPGEVIALQFAQVVPLTDFGVLVHATRFTEDRRAALRLFVRYGAVLSENIEVSLIEGAEEAFLRIHHPLDHIDDGHAAEFGLGILLRTGQVMHSPEDACIRVEFCHAAHGPLDAYRDYFGVPCHFECPYNAMVYSSARLDERVQHAGDPQLVAYLQEHLDAVRDRLLAQGGSSEQARVRTAIVTNAERGEYGAEALAQRLGMSLRTLQRQLREQGTTVAALLEEVRQANARQLLSDPRLGVDEIAFLLGYSSARAFRRACQRWTGMTPGKFRKTLVRS
ncbi:MAG: AraC family transcriptional regulator ligand-binding domain-containing protein [Myxococcota bacterium]